MKDIQAILADLEKRGPINSTSNQCLTDFFKSWPREPRAIVKIHSVLWAPANIERVLASDDLDLLREICQFTRGNLKSELTFPTQAFPKNSYIALQYMIRDDKLAAAILLLEYGGWVDHYQISSSMNIKKTELTEWLEDFHASSEFTDALFDYIKNKAMFSYPEKFTDKNDTQSLAKKQQTAAAYLRNIFSDLGLLPEATYYKDCLTTLAPCDRVIRQPCYPAVSDYWFTLQQPSSTCTIA